MIFRIKMISLITKSINLDMTSIESELIFEKIKEILKKHAVRKNVTQERTVQSIGFVSEELEDFLMSYAKLFNVDMAGYNYYNFFFEDVHPVYMIRDTFYRIFRPEKVRKKKLTLGHLVKVAEAGKWFNPE